MIVFSEKWKESEDHIIYDCNIEGNKSFEKNAFDNKAVQFVYDYLIPLLFNIDICDLFFSKEDYGIANYADDNTTYLS